MVAKRWRRLTLLVGLLLSVSVVWADEIRMAPNQVFMGQAVTWVLEGPGIESALEEADLTELKQSFYIERMFGGGDRLRIKMVPYHPGLITLNPIRLGPKHYQPPVIEVTENPAIKVVWQAPKTDERAYQNQVVYWRTQVLAEDAEFSISVELPENGQGNVQWLETAKEDGRSGILGHQWRYTSGVQLIETGEFSVSSPSFWVRNATQQQWLFVAPPINIRVQPLPGFVPRNLPVGKLQLTSEFPKYWVEKGALQIWRWRLDGTDLPLKDFPNLIEGLPSQQGFEWLSASKWLVSNIQLDGLHSSMKIEQPFRVNQYGWVRFPPLRLSYFDVETGKLVDQFVDSQGVLSVPSWMIWLAKALWILLMAMGLMVVLQLLRAVYLKRRLLHALRQAKQSEEIWKAIQVWTNNSQAWLLFNAPGLDGGEGSSQSLGQWLNWFENRYGAIDQAALLVAVLNDCFYGRTSLQVKRLALDWAKSLPDLDLIPLKMMALNLLSRYSVYRRLQH